MPKICEDTECNYPVFGGGYCKFHQWKRTDNKKPKRPKHFSVKRKEENKLYSIKRNKFLKDNPTCQICPVNGRSGKPRKSTEVHHKFRRVGRAFLDKETWIATCRPCHDRVEDDPEWAYHYGLLATQEELTEYYKK